MTVALPSETLEKALQDIGGYDRSASENAKDSIRRLNASVELLEQEIASLKSATAEYVDRATRAELALGYREGHFTVSLSLDDLRSIKQIVREEVAFVTPLLSPPTSSLTPTPTPKEDDDE